MREEHVQVAAWPTVLQRTFRVNDIDVNAIRKRALAERKISSCSPKEKRNVGVIAIVVLHLVAVKASARNAIFATSVCLLWCERESHELAVNLTNNNSP